MLTRLDPGTVMAYIDLAGLRTGRHQVPVRAEVGGTLATVAVRPAFVVVVIR